MAVGVPQGIYRHWAIQADATLTKLIEKGLDKDLMIIREQSGNFGKYIKQDKDIGVLDPKWAYEIGYPSKITAQLTDLDATSTTGILTFSGYLFGQAITSDYVSKIIRTDTILQNIKSTYLAQQVKVTALNGLTATVQKYGGTTLAAESSASTWEVVSSPYADNQDVEDPTNLEQKLLECTTQRISGTLELTETALNMDYELYGDPFEHEYRAKLIQLNNEQNKAFVQSLPYHDGTAYRTGLYTAKSTLCGLQYWPLKVQADQANTGIYVSSAGAKLSYKQLCNLAWQLENSENADFNSGKWAIVVNPMTRRYMQDYFEMFRMLPAEKKQIGWAVESLMLDNGKEMGIITDWYVDPGECYMLNTDDISWGYFKGGHPKKHNIAVQSGTYYRWQVTWHIYGLKIGKPRHIGKIYGLPRTYTG